MTSLLQYVNERIAHYRKLEESDYNGFRSYWRGSADELELVRQKVVEIAQELEAEGEDATFYQDSETHEMVTVKKALELIGQPT